MIAEQRQQTWVIANVGHNPGRIRAAVNGVPEEDKPILVPKRSRCTSALSVAKWPWTSPTAKTRWPASGDLGGRLPARDPFDHGTKGALYDKASFTRGDSP